MFRFLLHDLSLYGVNVLYRPFHTFFLLLDFVDFRLERRELAFYVDLERGGCGLQRLFLFLPVVQFGLRLLHSLSVRVIGLLRGGVYASGRLS